MAWTRRALVRAPVALVALLLVGGASSIAGTESTEIARGTLRPGDSWLERQLIAAGDCGSAPNVVTLFVDLEPYEGRTVGIIVTGADTAIGIPELIAQTFASCDALRDAPAFSGDSGDPTTFHVDESTRYLIVSNREPVLGLHVLVYAR